MFICLYSFAVKIGQRPVGSQPWVLCRGFAMLSRALPFLGVLNEKKV